MWLQESVEKGLADDNLLLGAFVRQRFKRHECKALWLKLPMQMSLVLSTPLEVADAQDSSPKNIYLAS